MAKSTKARQSAFSKAGTGNAKPGALSDAPSQGSNNNQTVMPSVPSNFVSLPSGKTGTTIPTASNEEKVAAIGSQTAGMQQKQADIASAQKIADIQAAQAKSAPAQGFLGTQMTPAAPTPAQQIMTPMTPNAPPAGQPAAQPAQQGYQGNNPIMKTIQAYFDWGDKLVKKPDGSYDTTMVMPGSFGKKAVSVAGSQLTKTGVGNKVITLIKDFFTKDVITVAAGGKYSTTNKLNWVAVTGVVAALTFVAKETLGGKNFGNFLGSEEASQTTIGAKAMAERYGTLADRQEARALAKEALDFDAGIIPIANVAAGVAKYQSIARRAIEIEERIDAYREANLPEEATAEDTAKFWTDYHVAIEANKTAEEKTRVDYFNAEKLRIEQEILKARSDYNRAEDSASRRLAQETAEFWLNYQREKARLEEEERIKTAQFWADYKKQVQQTQASSWDSGSSRLGFGLMR